MTRNLKIAAGVAALGLVGVGVAAAASGSQGGCPAGHDRGSGSAQAGPRGPGMSAGQGGGMGRMDQMGRGSGAGGMGSGGEPGMRGGPMSGMGMGGMGMGGMGVGMGGMGMEVESEFDYITQMIPHHEEAVATAKLVEAGTKQPEMRAFARNIVKTQTAEIAQMKKWLATWYPGRDTKVDYEPMMGDLKGLSGDALDRAFLEDMIHHHMMAVMMSQQLLTGGLAKHQELVPFATKIRNDQRAEIRTMATWLSDRFGDSPMGGMMGRSGMHG